MVFFGLDIVLSFPFDSTISREKWELSPAELTCGICSVSSVYRLVCHGCSSFPSNLPRTQTHTYTQMKREKGTERRTEKHDAHDLRFL